MSHGQHEKQIEGPSVASTPRARRRGSRPSAAPIRLNAGPLARCLKLLGEAGRLKASVVVGARHTSAHTGRKSR
jgi:hypothetical protein